ncbi:MAG: F0F1 ATP synthase subunit B [Ignavibacteriae bacterium]|nr:F0F1 ATP synthase subunit B [Ignavibacteriota bacterium]
MERIMDIEPGLMIWTIFSFLIFLAILVKFGTKPLLNGLNARENRIKEAIENADKANEQAQKILKETDEKLSTAQIEMAEIVRKGKVQAEELIKKASDEADKVKKQKVDEAIREIERNKENAIKQLRTEVASLVVAATEKILDETLDKEKHYKMVESYIAKLPNN